MSIATLYICYLSVDEPLVQTQVLPYLRGLAAGGHRMHLLTFDRAPASDAMRRELRAQGITWHHARYHHRPRLLATVFDVVMGALIAIAICLRYRLQMVHARSHVPAAMGLAVGAVLKRRMIFDVRGLMAEEYADVGVWRVGSAGYRVTKAVERLALRRADGVVVLTERVRDQFAAATGRPDLMVIPCCADVEAIAAVRGQRDAIRRRLGVAHRPVLLYVGKFGGWYMEREMVTFFVAAKRVIDNLFFLVLTQSDPIEITEAFSERGVPDADFRVMQVDAHGVSEALAAADLGLALIRCVPSKIASSPTKVGEYLGGGVPVVVTAGIGDVDHLVRETRTGILVTDTSEAGLLAAACHARALVADPTTADRCRAAGAAHLSLRDIGIPRYRDLYAAVSRRG